MAYHQLDTSAQSQGIAAFHNFVGEWSLGKLLHPLNSATATVTKMFGCVAHICCYTSKATTPTPGCSEFLCDCGMTGMCRLHGNWHQMEFNRFTGHFHLISTLSSVFTVVSSLNFFKLIEMIHQQESNEIFTQPIRCIDWVGLGKYLKGSKVVQVWALSLFGFSTSLASCEHLSLCRSVQYIDAWHKDDGGAFYCFAAHSQLFGSRRRRGLDRQRPLRSRQSVHSKSFPGTKCGWGKGSKTRFEHNGQTCECI